MPIDTENEERKKLEDLRRHYNLGFTIARHSIEDINKNIAELQPNEYKWPQDQTQKKELAQKHLEKLEEEKASCELWQSYYNWCLLNKAICFPRFLPDAGILFQGNAVIELHLLTDEDENKLRAYIRWVNKQVEIVNQNIAIVKEALK